MTWLPPDLGHWAFGFVLLLARIVGMATLLPGLGESAPPAMLRAGIALCLTLLLLPGLMPAFPQPPEPGLAAGAMVIAEVLTGLWFGWLARLPMLALPMAGQIMAALMGLSNILQAGADMGPQTSVLARLFEVAAPMLILTTGLYQQPIAAVSGLYGLVPAGTMVPAGDGIQALLLAVAACFTLALRLSAPFVVAGLTWQMATGLTARFLPRLQIYFVAVPGQILGGMVLLAILSTSLLAAFLGAMRLSLSALPGG